MDVERLALAILGLLLSPVDPALAEHRLTLPAPLAGRAVILQIEDRDYGRADLGAAVRQVGEGGISRGLVVRLTSDVTVFRLWSGPKRRDALGNTNRVGHWWTYDLPRGSQQEYRRNYAVCLAWNDLTWVARCTLRKGAVIAVGPGNSVSAKACGDPAGRESYPQNERDWQLFIANAQARAGADKDLDCPAETDDYEAELSDIALQKAAPGASVR